MTGMGCYGRPRHIARTLERALTRFGLTSSDLLTVAWRPDPLKTGCGRQAPGSQLRMPGGRAAVLLSRHGRVKGFFLTAAEDGPRLHVRVRSAGKDL